MSNKLLAVSSEDTVRESVSTVKLKNEGTRGLHKCARQGHDFNIKIYLDHEVDVNIRGHKNITPLMQAADGGHLSTAQILISRGADLELRDSNGETALMHAAKKNYSDLVSELLKRGAKEDVTDNWNETALQTAELLPSMAN